MIVMTIMIALALIWAGIIIVDEYNRPIIGVIVMIIAGILIFGSLGTVCQKQNKTDSVIYMPKGL